MAEQEAWSSILKRFEHSLEQDPKPIFDHIRNIGISVGIIGGGSYVHDKYIAAASTIQDKLLLNFAVFNVIAIGVFTLWLNTRFAKKSILAIVYGENYKESVFLELIKSISFSIKVLPLIRKRDAVVYAHSEGLKYLLLRLLITSYMMSMFWLAYITYLNAPKFAKAKSAVIYEQTTSPGLHSSK